MKKIKSISCMLILSTCMVGNVFAGDSTGSGVLSFFDSVINAVVSYVSADDCDVRICSNCKPGESDGNCKPTE